MSLTTCAMSYHEPLPNLDEYYHESILPQLQTAVQPTWPYQPDYLTAVSGISDGVWSSLRALSVPGDRVAIETPTQPPLLRIVKNSTLSHCP
ncbi:hypothetical protein [Rhodococcus jostii]|uniref:Uncharacterized protein n=1 Tax=Rhodococcus jostii TaxID=132919 RepID=A0ABU4CLT5_RHOJO|nr:hypothetical protein [Rhodococcus jostii]MDV6284526.1 hypothetical protein [Rhodococcus jostii]